MGVYLLEHPMSAENPVNQAMLPEFVPSPETPQSAAEIALAGLSGADIGAILQARTPLEHQPIT